MNSKIGNPAQVCSAVRSQVTDGRGRGARLIHVANGKLNFVVLESNALDILQLWHEGDNVGFLSRNGLYAPADDFLHSFPAGMLYTCGPDAIGGVEGHPIHGRLHAIPATVVELKAGEEGVRIVGEIRDAALFGEDLVLTRTIETKAGSSSVMVTDVLENCAFHDEKYCLLYHVNVGYPMLDVGARLEAKILESKPRTPWAAHEMKKMLEIEPPADDMEEQCFFHRTADGVFSLVNRKLGKRFTVRSNYRKYVEWKSRASGDYVVGLEPCSTWLDDLKYSTLKPGAKTVNRLTLEVETLSR